MKETVKAFLDAYDKMLVHAQKIGHALYEKKLEDITGEPDCFLVSYREDKDEFRIEMFLPEKPGDKYGEYLVVVLPSSEFYKSDPAEIDTTLIRME